MQAEPSAAPDLRGGRGVISCSCDNKPSSRGVYPIIDDADPYGVGSSGPAVPAGSGLTAPGLAEVASWRSATRPDAARIRTLLIKPGYVRGQVPNAPGRYAQSLLGKGIPKKSNPLQTLPM